MSSLIDNATIQVRRDTAANWSSVNPMLASGEWGKETDTGRLKQGDGSTAWNSLSYNDAVFPVGYIYTQYPGKNSPIDMGFFGTWENISDEYPGYFFRSEDGGSGEDNASEFESGVQQDAMQRITGSFGLSDDAGLQNGTELNGVFGNGSDKTLGIPTGSLASTATRDNNVSFDSSESTSPNTAKTDDNETRPINVTIRLWERTA